jgi:formylglycine-generating enzyme required for sulfatase activity
MDRTEVTVGAYRTCVERGACSTPATGANCNWGDSARLDHPINCIDWCQAAAFCRASGKRLPTGYEWLWAARGREQGWTYPWGNDPPDDTRLCWRRYDFEQRRGEGTCAAASFPRGASPDGVLGLAGNVREWTASGWRFAREPREMGVRGGAWQSDLRYSNVRSESDYRYAPWHREPTIGVRCVQGAAR